LGAGAKDATGLPQSGALVVALDVGVLEGLAGAGTGVVA
jgi:hypothetical protein